jgi:4'-phosphopantetheinyl transferase
VDVDSTARRVAHAWSVEPEAIGEELMSRLSVLSAEERARMASFRFERDRIAYAAAHVLVRVALSWCAPSVPPASWDLTQSRNERPEVVAPKLSPRLRFNISHTHGLVACLVTDQIDCGIDVEVRRPVDDMEAVVARVLSPAEIAALMALPDHLRPDRFFCYWTLKEAYVKARGLGLSLPLEAVSFDLRAEGAVVTLGTSVDDHGPDWQFEQWSPTAHHVVAVAIRSGAIRDVRLVRHSQLPV